MKNTRESKGRPILLGVAEPLTPEVREEVERVRTTPGFWIATDVNQPGADVPLASVDGKIFSMRVDKELAPERFLETVRFVGPFRGKH